MAEVNPQRAERQGFDKSTKGRQGAFGSGKEKVCSQGDSGKAPNFQPAADVIGEEIVGSLDVPNPGGGVVKGASLPSLGELRKGKPGKPMPNGPVAKPKAAEEAGH